MAITAVPFFRPPSSTVQASEWIVAGEVPEKLGAILPFWDYQSRAELRRAITIDVGALRAATLLENADGLACQAFWTCPGSFLRGAFPAIALDSDGACQSIVLQGSFAGTEVVGSIRLQTAVLLAARTSSAHPLSPRLLGTILWQDEVVVAVEGNASRFPVEVVDFQSVVWAPNDAGWYLSWNSFEMEQSFLASVRLFINSEHTEIVSAVLAGPAEAAAKAIRSAIYFDVARLLIRGALLNEEFLDRYAGYEEGSVGSAVSAMLRLYFPGQTPRGLLDVMCTRPEFFDSDLQAKFRLFRD